MKKSLCIKFLLMLFVILVIPFNSYAAEELIKSQRLNSPLNIDGSQEDWGGIELFLDKKVKTECALKNNDETLFILFVLKDRKYFSSIQSSGMTIWFNTDGKKKKDYGIKFLKNMVTAADYIATLEQQKGPLSEEDKKKILENPSYVFHQVGLINKKKTPSGPDVDEEAGKSVFRTGSQQKMMVYEFAVPLSMFPELEPAKILKVGFEWGGMTDALRKRMRDRQAQSGDGRFGEKRLSGSAVRNPAKYTRWVDVQLSEKE